VVLALLSLFYKGSVVELPFAPGTFEVELVILLALPVTQQIRYFFGHSAHTFENSREKNHFYSIFGLLTLPIWMIYGYFLQLQTYVTRLDYSLCTAAILLTG